MTQPATSVRWIVEPESRFTPADLRQLHHGETTVVKRNAFRTIYRLRLAGLDVHVKLCRPIGLRAWLREWLRPAKAVLEYRNLCRLRERGIRTLEPLAAASIRRNGPGASVLLTQTMPGAATLGEFLHRQLPQLPPAEQSRCRHMLARSIGEFLAQLQAAGVRHFDLHPENLLLAWDGDAPRLHLLDVHAVRIAPSRIFNFEQVVLINRWFALRASRTDRLRCWRALERHLSQTAWIATPDPRLVEQWTLSSNQRLWRSRSGRCLADNRYFQRLANGFAIRDLDAASIQRLMANPAEALRRSGRILKDSRSSTVAEIVLHIDGVERRLILKRFRARSWWDRLRSLMRVTACLRSWQNGHAFRDAMLPTPRPIAVWHERCLGFAGDGYLLQERAEGIDLRSCLREIATQPRRKQAVVDAVARLVRTMHQRGWSHRDLKASNILVSFDGDVPRVLIVDLVGAVSHRRVSENRRRRDLARLNASFWDMPAISRSDRLRFLRTYFNWNVHGKPDWKKWWRQVTQFTQDKQARNVRRGRVLA